MNSAVHFRKKIAIVVFSYYPHDLRIRRAAEAALKALYRVDLYCLREEGQPRIERQGALTIYRLNILRSRTWKLNYIIEYLSFLVSMFLRLSIGQLTEPYDLIHINNMPDVLVFAAVFPKLAGTKIILDLHDPTPEVFMAKYGVGENSTLVRSLVQLERVSIRFVDLVLTTNIAFKNLFIGRGCPPDKIRIVMNAPDDTMFASQERPAFVTDLPKTFRVVFNGTIVERHGLDTAIDAVMSLKVRIPKIRFDIYGDGDYADRIRGRIAALGIDSYVAFHGFIHIAELSNIIRQSDVGVIPNRLNVFTDINFPVRIFEYLALSIPVIAPKTRGILDYFTPDDLLMFEPGNPADLAEKIYFVYAEPQKAQDIIKKGREIYKQHRWALQRAVLIKSYEGLLRKRRYAE